jgi:hypothetical protein
MSLMPKKKLYTVADVALAMGIYDMLRSSNLLDQVEAEIYSHWKELYREEPEDAETYSERASKSPRRRIRKPSEQTLEPPQEGFPWEWK